MGCGKSSVGRHLASLTGHRFVDTDELVSNRAGMAISDIFALNGEAAFRDMETAELQELVGVCGIILATGGGLVLRSENQALLRQIGVVGWIHADPDILFERVSRNNRRPLLQTDTPRQTFDNLLNARLPIYQQACDFQVDTGKLPHEQAAQAILEEALRAQARRIQS